MNQPEPHEFADREALAQALSYSIATALSDAIKLRGRALLAVSGGSTPRELFKALSAEEIDWSKVTVTLVDERFVPPSHERSNHRLVAACLLQNAASSAHFIPLYNNAETPTEAAKEAARQLEQAGDAIDVAVLGMGSDGHTASWFPGNEGLPELTSPTQEKWVMAAEGTGVPEPRLTMTLPRIAGARLLVLHIEGADKKETLDQALTGEAVEEMPIRAIFNSDAPSVQLYWAP